MPITLFGLVHRVEIVRITEIADGAGGFALDEADGATETTILASLQCRVAKIEIERDEARGYGLDAGHYWRVVAAPTTGVLRGDFMKLPSGNKTPASQGYYRIIWLQHFQDEHGNDDHLSFFCEFQATTMGVD